MRGSSNLLRPLRAIVLAVGLLVTLGATGCQYQLGGQTLPSPYWMTDDVQYYAPGPEFKLAREAAAQKAAQAQQELQRR
jgi:hypothetical protein